MVEIAQRRQELSRAERIVVLAAVVGVLALYSLAGPLLVRIFSVRERWFLEALLMGIYLGQLALNAVWTALGPGRLFLRVAWGLLTVMAIFVCYEAGTFAGGRVDPQSQYRDLVVSLLIFTWVAIACGLLLFRGVTEVRLVHRRVAESPPGRFHLRQLLTAIALISAVLAIKTRLEISAEAFFPVSSASRWILFPAILAGIFGVAITIPVLVAAFRAKMFLAPGVISFAIYGIWGVGVPTTIGFMMWPEEIGSLLLVLLGAVAGQAICLVPALLAIRAAGYDLRIVDAVVPARENAAVREEDPWTEED